MTKEKLVSITINTKEIDFVYERLSQNQTVEQHLAEARRMHPSWTSMVLVLVNSK